MASLFQKDHYRAGVPGASFVDTMASPPATLVESREKNLEDIQKLSWPDPEDPNYATKVAAREAVRERAKAPLTRNVDRIKQGIDAQRTIILPTVDEDPDEGGEEPGGGGEAPQLLAGQGDVTVDPTGENEWTVTIGEEPFTLTYDGDETDELAIDVTSTAFRTAINGLGATVFTVTGSAGGPFVVKLSTP